jgi:hypothetical protein
MVVPKGYGATEARKNILPFQEAAESPALVKVTEKEPVEPVLWLPALVQFVRSVEYSTV